MSSTEDMDSEESSAAAKLARLQIHQIWDRARSNAFAHRCAAERYRKRARTQFLWSLISGMLGILAVLLAFVATSYKFKFCGGSLSMIADEMECGTLISLILSIASVALSSLGLLLGIVQNYEQNEVNAETHNNNQHSFLYICQRAREPRWPGLSNSKTIEILNDLERDFQILKARGQEPQDIDFKAGDKLLEEIKHSSAHVRQSYQGSPEIPDEDDEKSA
jgi:hypothetical protein